MSRLLITPSSGGTTSPLTTKGDLYTHSTVDARLPVGTDGQFLLSDSTQTTGLKWNTIGTNSLVYGETPSGTVNGSNTSFTIASTPVSGTLMLFRDGQLLVGGGADYTLSSTTITMTTAPVTGSVLLAYYQVAAASTTFAADTVDGYHANATPTANNIPVLDAVAGVPEAAYLGGWVNPSETWVYASASTFTILGVDRTSVYTKGTRLRFKQGGAYKYAVVVASAFSTNTTVTIAVNTDYTIANASITDNYYSYMANPQGYPTWFNWTPTYGALGSMTFGTVSTAYAKYKIDGSSLTFRINFSGTTGGSASNGITFTIPVNRLQTVSYDHVGECKATDSTNQWGNLQFDSTASTISVYKTSDANWGIGANNGITGSGIYDI